MSYSKKLIEALHRARSVCVLTGAGVSAESGVPTFRGDDGLWKKFKPEELANFDSFIRNPELVWEW
ncbi:MAG: NAD-dependent protein deacylase, partial [Ignavibacteriales bacterium]|nr:NAD-dependent protein deacylase [Ignavibacteriales bacterium]